jgi:hypothetical protein
MPCYFELGLLCMAPLTMCNDLLLKAMSWDNSMRSTRGIRGVLDILRINTRLVYGFDA